MSDNEGRASRGWDAIHAYANANGYDTRIDDDHEAAAKDLVSDVLHAVERFSGWDTERVYARALDTFRAELREEKVS